MEKKTLEENYLEYKPEEDPNGSQGMELADQVIGKYGSIENMLKVIKKDKKANSLEKALEILSQTNPKDIINFGNGRTFNGIFRKLKKAGYEVKDYSRMDGPQKWGYYISLMKEFDLLNKK